MGTAWRESQVAAQSPGDGRPGAEPQGLYAKAPLLDAGCVANGPGRQAYENPCTAVRSHAPWAAYRLSTSACFRLA